MLDRDQRVPGEGDMPAAGEDTHLLATVPVVPYQHHTIAIAAREERVHRRPACVAGPVFGGGAASGP